MFIIIYHLYLVLFDRHYEIIRFGESRLHIVLQVNVHMENRKVVVAGRMTFPAQWDV